MRYFYLLFLLSYHVNFSQADFVDDKYLEDQIYFGLNYNSLINTPLNFKQNKFSNSLNFGFIRDMPLNKRRNFGLGLGLGLSFSSVNSNMVFSQNDELFTVNLVENNSFLKNKLNTTKIEIPFEIRWRTSTPSSYKFWRTYIGIKTSYILSSNYKYQNSNYKYSTHNLPLNKFQTGLTVSAGNNTWNLNLYLGLDSIFKNDFVRLNPDYEDLRELNLGLIFYIL